MGLGPARAFTLAEARERNRKLVRQKLADGIDPLSERRAAQAAERAAAAKMVTFAEAAELYIAGNASKWRNASHARQWSATLRTYVHPILGSLPVSDDRRAARVESSGATHRDRACREFLEDPDRNCESRPWSYRNGLGLGDRAWPADRRQSGELEDDRQGVAAALRQGRRASCGIALRRRSGLHGRACQARGRCCQALLFTILTAARSGETLGARWDEIDLAKQTWTVPAARMKAHVEHIVPLSPIVLDLLAALPRESGNKFVFIGSRSGRGVSHDAMFGMLAALGRSDLTVHGYRSSFRDWAAEQTAFSHDVCEAALAHTVGDASERAYRRTKQLPRRRQLMDAWATYCLTAPVAAGDNVVGLSR